MRPRPPSYNPIIYVNILYYASWHDETISNGNSNSYVSWHDETLPNGNSNSCASWHDETLPNRNSHFAFLSFVKLEIEH